MASPNFSQTQVFASLTAYAAARLGLLVPVSCLRCSPSQPGSIGLLLRLDSIPSFRSPPKSLGIVATTGTGDLTATALDSGVDNGSGEHGPFGLNVPSLPQNLDKTLLEVGVEDLPYRGICQMFPADPHNVFGLLWTNCDKHRSPVTKHHSQSHPSR